MTVRRVLPASLLALLATLLLALPAAAHPFVRGGEVAVDSLATISLDLAHGCGTEDASGGDPTREVALEVPDWLRIVDVAEADGYEVDVEEDDGRAAVVVWTAVNGGEPAPVFDLDVVAEGEPGEERWLRVSQACDGFTYRWIGTPDEPADDPAVRVTLTAADPESPPPPPDEATEELSTADDDAAAEAGDEQEPVEEGGDPEAGDAAVEDTPALEGDEAGEETGGGLPWILFAALAVVILAGVVLAQRSRGAKDAPADPADRNGPAGGVAPS